VKARELMKLLAKDGWKVVRIEGSHHIHKHPTKSGILSVPLHHTDVPTGTLNQILKIAGLK
jgi:predicted RNA binding protein YcfA (HicA-like mRNA interferase family)